MAKPPTLSLRRGAVLAAVPAALGAIAWATSADLRSPAPRAGSTTSWEASSAVGFGAVAATTLDATETATAGQSGAETGATTIEAWTLALDGEPEAAARAAVLLGASLGRQTPGSELHRRAVEALRGHLLRTAGQPKQAREALGSAIVAAAALKGVAATDSGLADELVALAMDTEAPHPDLAVRVEAAASALAVGRRDVVPFLLAVLRAETPAEAESPRTWPRITTLAWVKTRASRALSDAAKTDRRYRPDGSWAHQVQESARLEALLGEAAPR